MHFNVLFVSVQSANMLKFLATCDNTKDFEVYTLCDRQYGLYVKLHDILIRIVGSNSRCQSFCVNKTWVRGIIISISALISLIK